MKRSTSKRAIKSSGQAVYSAGGQLINLEPWLAEYGMCDPAVRHHWANQWLTRTADNLERMWPRVYQLLDAVRELETWRAAGDASFEAYVERLLKQPWEVFERLERCHHFASVAAPELFKGTLAAAEAALEAADQRPKPGKRVKTNDYIRDNITNITGTGTSRNYLASRLKKQHPEIVDRLRAGEFPSIHAAAIAAGIVKVKSPLQHLQHWWMKATPEERAAFMQWMTP